MPEGPLKTEVFGGVAAWTLVAWAVAWLDGVVYISNLLLSEEITKWGNVLISTSGLL